MKTFFIDWNLIPYAEAWQRQTEWFDNIVRAKVQGESYENRIVMCEHPHVYTLGRSGMTVIVCLYLADTAAFQMGRN